VWDNVSGPPHLSTFLSIPSTLSGAPLKKRHLVIRTVHLAFGAAPIVADDEDEQSVVEFGRCLRPLDRSLPISLSVCSAKPA
jgi:hypothetical protein